MTKRARTALFVVCVFLFLLAVPSVVLYSQGYRFDWDTKQVTQTGAFYFKALPRNADVYINEEFKKKTSVLTGSTLIENLLPKTYKVEIKKEGCWAWQKSLEVKEKQVTEAKNIVLIPEDLDFTILSTSTDKTNGLIADVETSATSSDKKKIVESNNYEIWILFLEDQNGQPQRKAGEKLFLTRFSKKIGEVFWLTNYYLIFSVGDKIKVAEIDDRDKINIIDLAEFEKPEIFWDVTAEKLYILSNKTLYLSESLLP